MKKSTYLIGVASGVVLASYWKVLVKESIKVGVRAGRQVKKISDQVMEDLEDARAEAFDELQGQEQKAER